MSKKTKAFVLCIGIFVLLAASALGILFFTRKDEPVAKGNVLGVAWYDEDGKEFTISTAEELREFAELSKHYNFKGQTIKLGADIVDNEGTATDWEYEVPEHLWIPIVNFAGTFDGQGHTISGICGYGFVYGSLVGTTGVYLTAGLFNNTQTGCVIKDFRLVNSFFLSDFNEGVGSITNRGGGTFESIYSNATILSYKQNAGGLIGILDSRGTNTVTNCWFDGEIRIEGNTACYIGGIVAQVKDTGGNNKIEHCLNTASITSPVTGRGIQMGGLVGLVQKSARLNMKDCLNVGTVTNEYGVCVGSVLGNMLSSSAVNMTDVYTTVESYSKLIGNRSGTANGLPIEVNEKRLTGQSAYQWTNLDFENYWSAVEDDTPVLKYFTDTELELNGVEKCFDTSWYSNLQSVFEIKTIEELYGFAYLSRTTDFSGQLIKLGADIVVNEGDASAWVEEAPQYNWLSIGGDVYPFNGIFDGDMHSISGIYLETKSSYSGLFSMTTELATIKNLKLLNSCFKFDGQSSGSIAGRGRGTFDTIYSDAIVIGSQVNLGGMVGQVPGNGGIKMNNCWFDGSVTHIGVEASERKCAGLVAVIYSDSVITNCLNTGTISANLDSSKVTTPYAGGIVGQVAKEKTLTMSGCLNVGKVQVSSAAKQAYGSLVGYVTGTINLTDSYAIEESCAKHTLRQCEAGDAVVFSQANMTGYQAYQRTLLNFDEYWAVVKDDTPILKSFANDVPSLAGVKPLYDISWYNADKKTYVLDSKEDLYGFVLMSHNTNFAGKTVKLAADIVYNGGNAANWANKAPANAWIAIGSNTVPFSGTFDGGMHSISGIYLNAKEAYQGLFSTTSKDATIKNLKLTNSYFETSALSFGSIAGRGRGTFDTIYSDAIVVTSNGNVGGLIGQVPGGAGITMTNCWFNGSVTNTGNETSERKTGGLVGVIYTDSTISNCLNSGTIDVTKYTTESKPGNKTVEPFAGGLVGHWSKITVTMSSCLNVGKINVSDAATKAYGPIIGYMGGKINIQDTYATTESCKSFSKSRMNGLIAQVDTSLISGVGSYQWMMLDFNKYWAAVTGTPILKAFAGETLNLAGIQKMLDFSWYEQAKGTQEDPYILLDAADLFGFANLSKESDFAGKTVKLGADIVVNSDITNPQYSWLMIGSSNKAFQGTFDGQMHSISGLYLKTDERYSGLFSKTGANAKVQNLILENSYFETTNNDCGSIVGQAQGTFSKVYSDAIVKSSKLNVGGLIGSVAANGYVDMDECWYDGNASVIDSMKEKRQVGGLIGYILNSKSATPTSITNCLNSGTIDVTSENNSEVAAGGLVGRSGSSGHLVISDSLNVGSIIKNDKTTKYYGSIIGYNPGTVTVTTTYATTESCKKTSGESITSGRIEQVKEDSMKGYSGYQWTILDFDNYWAVVKNPSDDTPILKSFASEVPDLASVQRMIDFSWMEQAAGTEEDPYILSDVADLYGFAQLSQEVKQNGFSGKHIRLGADIVVNQGDAKDWSTDTPDYGWIQIGSGDLPFEGTFDGQMHTISGVYLNTSSQYGGLFSVTGANAKICNLKLKNSYFETSANNIGSIAGQAQGTFSKVYSDAIVKSSAVNVGGLIGRVVASGFVDMDECWFAGTVSVTNSKQAERQIGGLIGFVLASSSSTSITNCLNSGTIDVTSEKNSTVAAGGLVGRDNAGNVAISNSLNIGLVKQNTSTTKYYGPIIGRSKTASLSMPNTYATTESCSTVTVSGLDPVPFTTVAESTVIGWDEATILTNLGDKWAKAEFRTPTLIVFENESNENLDVSWFDKASYDTTSEYTLYDAADLYGLACISETYDFRGKTIKLGADIVVNKGTVSADMASTSNYRQWQPIGSSTTPFDGTFDGQMHTISGVYLKTSSQNGGLFSVTGANATICNFKLKNSCFETTANQIGSIAGHAKGTFSNIYSDAIVKSSAVNVGGLIGRVVTNSFVDMDECWFAGTVSVTNSKKAERQIGGLIGFVLASSSSTSITNCLNSGTIDVTSEKNSTVAAGGLVGRDNAGNVAISNSLNVGLIKKSSSTTKYYGPIIGRSKTASLTMPNTYATEESCSVVNVSNLSPVPFTSVSESTVISWDAATILTNLGGAWSKVENRTPKLTVFINESDGRELSE